MLVGSTAFLAMYLQGPLQSWGHGSKLTLRNTLSFPTRSGIIGLICAAMGIERTDAQRLEQFRRLRMTVLAFGQTRRMIDFHTIGGGWDKSKHPQNISVTADGTTGATVVSRREYLEDARFGVILSGDRMMLEEIAQALRHPRWGTWLGRKSCIPTVPIGQGIFPDADAARERLQSLAGRPLSFRVDEVECVEEGTDTLLDEPLDFSTRSYGLRRISRE
jgi:CRISPR system Cascade subunit CasD